MDRGPHECLHGLQASLKQLLQTPGLHKSYFSCFITQEHLLTLRKQFEQAVKIFSGAAELTEAEVQAKEIARTNIGIIDAMIATLQELEDKLRAMNLEIFVPDAKHIQAAEEERLERIKARKEQMIIRTISTNPPADRSRHWYKL